MKYFVLFITLLMFSCEGGSSFYINRFFKFQKLSEKDKKKKQEISTEHEKVIQRTLEAYDKNYGVNKDLGHKLLMNRNYEPALVHLKKAFDIKSSDAAVVFDIAVCNVNLYRINKGNPGYLEYLSEADRFYNIALNITPTSKEILYAYSHLLVFGIEDYAKAIKYLTKIVNELKRDDVDSYFLLGRAYYMAGEYKKANDTYMKLYDFEKKLNKKERYKLDQFIMQTQKMKNS